jgi:saccharopine dehydrogenase-like NADP-dependent oxidoreductase
MKTRIIVLGCGLIGTTIARDLAADERFDVTVADVNRANLDKLAGNQNITPRHTDVGGPDGVKAAIMDSDLVVGALPSTLGFRTLQAVIECGKPTVDISFMAEDPIDLDALAKQHRVTAVVDCGVAPGLANMIVGRCHALLDRADDVAIYVGGLPKLRRWPFQYKAPFAPADVLEEYTRPARMVENGKVVVKPALSEPELIDFPNAGTLEAVNTDGLRSLIRTIDARNMKEKTLRYPGHVELMRVFRETGLLGKDEVEVGNVKIRPLDLTSKLLFPKWALEPDEEEFTILRVVVEGRRDGKTQRLTYDLYDEYDAASGETSMARTTGFPCAIVARMLAGGEFNAPGVFPPERLGQEPGLLDRMTEELSTRGVTLTYRAEATESHAGPRDPAG